MDNKKELQRSPNYINIPKSYKILERLYNNGDVKYYIKITEYTTKEGVYMEYYYKKEFDNIDSVKEYITQLRHDEEPLLTEKDKIYDVTFDEKLNIKIDEKCHILDYKNIPTHFN